MKMYYTVTLYKQQGIRDSKFINSLISHRWGGTTRFGMLMVAGIHREAHEAWNSEREKRRLRDGSARSTASWQCAGRREVRLQKSSSACVERVASSRRRVGRTSSRLRCLRGRCLRRRRRVGDAGARRARGSSGSSEKQIVRASVAGLVRHLHPLITPRSRVVRNGLMWGRSQKRLLLRGDRGGLYGAHAHDGLVSLVCVLVGSVVSAAVVILVVAQRVAFVAFRFQEHHLQRHCSYLHVQINPFK